MYSLLPKFKECAGLLPAIRPEEAELYERHFVLLQKWNEQINLISRKSVEKAFANHYADSIQITDFGNAHTGELPIFDLGTGAGFPGIIFGIRYPEKRITLLEKSLKKQTFLSAAIGALELHNVSQLGPFPDEKLKGFFFARAVHPPKDLFQFFLKRALPGSRFVLNVGGEAEVPLPPKRISLREERKYTLPEDAGNRRVLLFSLS